MIDPVDMIEAEEYFAFIQVNADVANGYKFASLEDKPNLTLPQSLRRTKKRLKLARR